jgi:predicted metal-dependent hydrolase
VGEGVGDLCLLGAVGLFEALLAEALLEHGFESFGGQGGVVLQRSARAHRLEEAEHRQMGAD